MSITPIEMYTMVPKSQEAGTLRHGELLKNADQKAEAAMQFDRNIVDNSQRTVKMKESDSPEYTYDKDGGGKGAGYSSGRRNKQDNKEEKPSGLSGYMGPGGIDIRI